MKRRRGLYKRIIDLIVKILVKEHRGYHHRFPHDLEKLQAALKPGDVLLVEGSQRISEVIKYLTQSSWSHAALYVGDSLVKRGGQRAVDLKTKHGEETEFLLVEATVEEGVAEAPLSKYLNHNIRICRPINLRPGDLNTVLDTVMAQIGDEYNVGHVIDLLRYFFPVTLIGRWRRAALAHAGSATKEVICSSQIAMAFQKVRYPIQPAIDVSQDRSAISSRLPRWLPFGKRQVRNNVFNTGIFTPCDPNTVTPRDFDLSPYFQVVKIAVDNKQEFDYKKMNWRMPASETDESDTKSKRSLTSPNVPAPAGTKAG